MSPPPGNDRAPELGRSKGADSGSVGTVLPRILPPRPDGRRVSIDAVYRWSLRGLHGVRLRRFRVGGAWCTTTEELTRWSAAITAATESMQ